MCVPNTSVALNHINTNVSTTKNRSVCFSADTERTFAWLQLSGMATTVVTASARLNGLLVAIS
jgi:hypothetical protein